MNRFETKIMTRGYEMDTRNLISAAGYLRYMEQVRWLAYDSEAAEFLGLLGSDHFFVIAGQGLEVLDYVGRGTELAASLWVKRVGRTSIDFAQVLQRSQNGAVVARAVVTAVHIGSERKPEPLPERYRSLALGDDGEVFNLLTPTDISPPETAWTYDFRVRPSDLDLLNHVNHSNYLAYFEDARILGLAAGAFAACSFSSESRPKQVSLDYRQQAIGGELVRVLAWVYQRDPACMAFRLNRQTDNQVLCRASMKLGAV